MTENWLISQHNYGGLMKSIFNVLTIITLFSVTLSQAESAKLRGKVSIDGSSTYSPVTNINLPS